jgi:hypothetical protein
MDDAIKRALEVAADDLPRFNDMYEGTPEQAAAAAIAAFLEALPEDVSIQRARVGYSRADFARMVQRAAG